MLETQGSVVVALIAFTLLGVGTIALIAFLGARRSAEDGDEPELSPLDAVERAIQVRREHAFLQRHPEWNGRDFRSDPESPWHSEAEVWQTADRDHSMAGTHRI